MAYSSLKRIFAQDTALGSVQHCTARVIVPIHIDILQIIYDMATHSGLCSCGFALLIVAHQVVMIISMLTSLEKVGWKQTAAQF
jgi:hypothetical protein